MSLRTELEELVDWLADRPEAPQTKTRIVLVTKEQWELISANLTRAADSFAKGAEGFNDEPARSLLVELSRDLEHETRSLAMRARVLRRRAPSEADSPAPSPEVAAPEEDPELERLRERRNIERAKARQLEATASMALADAAKEAVEIAEVSFRQLDARLRTATDADVRGRLNDIQDLVHRALRSADAALVAVRKDAPLPKSAGDHLTDAMNSVETARGHATEGITGDAGATRFAEEVDVVSEMALSLRSRAWRNIK